ncbi:protein of unknown function [Brevefilum fermentans]|uniref:Uncharacterized protein n=1 Tax=Candidatus Brevifilum fermentans TaxID=1986204 RepID=A0A1Y6K3D1_9CHLR|nr:protein of unknown function [Brevefilum fermentans]
MVDFPKEFLLQNKKYDFSLLNYI